MTGPVKEPHLLQIQKSSQQTTEEGTSLDGADAQSKTWTHIYSTNGDLTHHRIDGVLCCYPGIPSSSLNSSAHGQY